MRIDVVTIFPAYLDALSLSLVGKAASSGLVTLAVHDLREVTTDRHRTVDDTPAGGGAGMVMRPDVWGKCLDSVLSLPVDDAAAGAPLLPPTSDEATLPDAAAGATQEAAAASGGAGAGGAAGTSATKRRVLAVPTPAGRPLTQQMVTDLASSDQLVIACGRYEGIDSRVPVHYAQDYEVVEYSIGDYVLNGGEVAALALIEAVVRLLPGVVGNPHSLVEESHGEAGLLEYPVYTRPLDWRGLEVPPVLLSGDHGKIERWRRNQALTRTATRRPDMLHRLAQESLDAADRAALAQAGWCLPQAGPALQFELRDATAADAEALSELATQTFPLACPPFLEPADIARHAATKLTPQAFLELLAAPGAQVRVAHALGEPAKLLGYQVSLLSSDGTSHPLGEKQPGAVKKAGYRPVVEFFKCYVRAELIGSGLAAALIEDAVASARREGAAAIWLGTHEGNKRAQRAYKRHGFKKIGKREFVVGTQPCRDVVMAKTLS
ncbi:MAG: tRNA (guanosine(37)-N1)-methyltransferase TrmD [Buchananella hordeovulneris]|nr:tRNA (guanosine(37)-N1)-methyltransferase TrmD [Buchananella hordeovulneris]